MAETYRALETGLSVFSSDSPTTTISVIDTKRAREVSGMPRRRRTRRSCASDTNDTSNEAPATAWKIVDDDADVWAWAKDSVSL